MYTNSQSKFAQVATLPKFFSLEVGLDLSNNFQNPEGTFRRVWDHPQKAGLQKPLPQESYITQKYNTEETAVVVTLQTYIW
jgi:hypothetical protein